VSPMNDHKKKLMLLTFGIALGALVGALYNPSPFTLAWALIWWMVFGILNVL